MRPTATATRVLVAENRIPLHTTRAHTPSRTFTTQQNCTKGRYSASTGSSACDDCVESYFANSAGSVSCLKCSSEVGYGYGPQYTSPAGSATCSECVKDSYMADNGKCKSKDKGIVAKEKGTMLETLELEGGYYRFSRTSTEVYACNRY